MGDDPSDTLGVFLPGSHSDWSYLTVGEETLSANGIRDGRHYLLEDSPRANRFEKAF